MTFYIDTSDKRNVIVKSLLNKKYKTDSIENIETAKVNDVLIYAPNKKFSQDEVNSLPKKTTLISGNISQYDQTIFSQKGINYKNLLNDKVFAIQNSNLTAEGVLSHLLTDSNLSIFEQKILILGNGKVGKSLSTLFYKLGLNFSVVSHDADNYAFTHLYSYNNYFSLSFCTELNKFDVIINTIPASILSNNDISKIKKEALFLEIASFETIDKEKAQFKYVVCPALPQKFSYITAGKFLYSAILRMLR